MGALLSTSGCGGIAKQTISDDAGGASANESGGSGMRSPAGGAASGGAPSAESVGGTASGGLTSEQTTPAAAPDDAYAPDGGTCPSGTTVSCEAPGDCVCRGAVAVTDCRDPAEWTCDIFGGTDCWCNPRAPRSPSDCESSEQFTCQQWSPLLEGCRCEAGAPASQADCQPCAVFTCHSYAPPVGCECVICIR